MVDITTKTAIGDAADQCPIDGDGQGLEIGFNNKYLMDALKAAPADKLRLEFSSSVAPCVILPAEGGGDLCLHGAACPSEGELNYFSFKKSSPRFLERKLSKELSAKLRFASGNCRPAGGVHP